MSSVVSSDILASRAQSCEDWWTKYGNYIYGEDGGGGGGLRGVKTLAMLGESVKRLMNESPALDDSSIFLDKLVE